MTDSWRRSISSVEAGTGRGRSTVAYLARAVTAGRYRLRAVFVEDMYQHWYNARGSLGVMTIEERVP